MQHRRPFGAFFAVCVLGTFLARASSQAWADSATEANPLELRKIMRELGKNMKTVTDGISREDWALVARIAPQLAEHPQPPMGEKMRILAFVGTDAAKFKGHDEKTHQAARALEEAAARNIGARVIAAFATLQNSCLDCHQYFRKPFVEHFYGQR